MKRALKNFISNWNWFATRKREEGERVGVGLGGNMIYVEWEGMYVGVSGRVLRG